MLLFLSYLASYLSCVSFFQTTTVQTVITGQTIIVEGDSNEDEIEKVIFIILWLGTLISGMLSPTTSSFLV